MEIAGALRRVETRVTPSVSIILVITAGAHRRFRLIGTFSPASFLGDGLESLMS